MDQVDGHAAARACDLASLLDPISVGDFVANHWERGPLWVQGRLGGHYDALLTGRDIENLVADPDARYPAIRLARDGWYYQPETFTEDESVGPCTFRGVPILHKICSEYAKGATIVMSALQRTWPPLRALCERLEAELDHPTNANLYITPGRAAGFPAHYDTHDVLVLQITGRKRWLIDEPTMRLPHRTQTFKPEGYTPGPRLMEVELQPGDLLYLPRGYGHSTTTGDSHSAHVTIGIDVYTWADLVGELVPSGVENPELRKALPPGHASRTELRPALTQQLKQILPALSMTHDLDRLLEQHLRGIITVRQRMPARFRADVVVISLDSLLRRAGDGQFDLTLGAEQVSLAFDGRRYDFPAPLGPTLSAMCARSTFRLRDLPSMVATEALLGFARYLQHIGFLHVC